MGHIGAAHPTPVRFLQKKIGDIRIDRSRTKFNLNSNGMLVRTQASQNVEYIGVHSRVCEGNL